MVLGDVMADVIALVDDDMERVYALPSSALRRILASFDIRLTLEEPDDLVWDLTADQMREVVEHSRRAIERLAAIRRAAEAVPDGPVLVHVPDVMT